MACGINNGHFDSTSTSENDEGKNGAGGAKTSSIYAETGDYLWIAAILAAALMVLSTVTVGLRNR